MKGTTTMNKKILILNGSPRANGNTVALIENFSKGAESAGNTIVRFDLQKMNIHACLGCCEGGKDPESPCVQKDDMEKIYPHYKDADILVLASPMYFWSISGQLKCAMDRLFAVNESDPNYAGPIKDCMLLMAAQDDTESNFEPVRHYYNTIVRNLGWHDRGILYAGGNFFIGDIAGKSQLEEAYKLGSSI